MDDITERIANGYAAVDPAQRRQEKQARRESQREQQEADANRRPTDEQIESIHTPGSRGSLRMARAYSDIEEEAQKGRTTDGWESLVDHFAHQRGEK